MAYEYNPLLKNNLQKKADTASVEAEIDELRQSKVTKFFSASDTLQNGEIAQYQGEDDPDNGLEKGGFYQFLNLSVESGDYCYNIINDFVYDEIMIHSGLYYKVKNLPPNSNRSLIQMPQNGDFFFYNDPSSLNYVNWKGFDYVNKKLVLVVSQSGTNVTLDDGRTFDFSSRSFAADNPILVVSDDGNQLIMSPTVVNPSQKLFVVSNYFGNYIPIVFEPYTEWSLQPISESAVLRVFSRCYVDIPGLSKIDSWTYNLPWSLRCSDLWTLFDIYISGAAINLNYDKSDGIPLGGIAGIFVYNYDGNGNDFYMGVDRNGIPRILTQRIATIAENPTNNQLLFYDNDNKLIKSVGNLYISCPGYATNGQSLTLIIPVSRINYYQNAIWCVVGMGNIDSVSYLRIKHGDVWSAVLDDIVSTSYLSVASITVDNSVATVVLSCNISGNNKYTFNALSTIPINSITVN